MRGMQVWRWCLGVAVFALVGCASVPVLEDAPASGANGPVAGLKFSKGYTSRPMVTGTQSYLVSMTPRCEDLKAAADLLWTSPDATVRRIGANQPVTILAATLYYVNAGYMQLTHPSCQRRGTFTPLAGHEYTVVSRAPMGEECNLEVVDQSTNRPPADLTVEDGATCLRVYQRELALRKAP